MRTAGTFALALTAALAACGDSPKVAPAPAPVAAPVVLPAPVPPPSETPPLPERVSEIRSAASRPLLDSAFLRTLESDPHVGIAWVEAPPFIVGQEYPIDDERDTGPAHINADGYVVEDPIAGTFNPGKARINVDRAAKARELAVRHARLAVVAMSGYREVVAAPPRLEIAERPIHLLALWTDKSWDAWKRGPGNSKSRGMMRTLVPADDLIVWRFGPETISGQDEYPCADERVQKIADQDLVRAIATLRLHRDAETQGLDLTRAGWTGRPLWLFEGVADLVGAVEVDERRTESLEGAAWTHRRIRLDHVALAREHRGPSEKWAIADLTGPEAYSEVLDLAGAPGRWKDSQLFRVRAWAFVHFLWNYDAGKYRNRLSEFLRASLAGDAATADFALALGRPDASDWGAIVMEFEWYWRALLRRKVGETGVKVEHPSTDAPVGAAQSDPEFLEVWEEEHRSESKPARRK